MEEVSSVKAFGGYTKQFKHKSTVLDCEMVFSVHLPPAAESGKVPAIYYLSGLTCTDQNFITKGGAQKYASEEGIALIVPDTSPRGTDLPGEHEAYDFGSGAGFYLNATEEPWKKNYNMYDYITRELPELVNASLPIDGERISITGHSMGGHGALTIALKNPGMYKFVSAFSPICNPINCPWGQKAFSGYLGDEDKEAWKQYDATELVKSYDGPSLSILIDQGTADNFYIQKQLLPENFQNACKEANVPLVLRMQDGYDHSYYFIATFIPDHVKHHAQALKA
eukprot:Clim_evm55s214 gene=Clim_evmTU55s214